MKSLFLVFALIISCFAGEVEIKGLKVGMQYDDVVKIFKLKKIENSYFATMKDDTKITIGGADTDFVSLKFRNKSLDDMMFSFKAQSFNSVLDAIKTKYKIKCESSKVQNRMGAVFEQVECIYNDGKTEMFIQKHIQSNVNVSAMMVWGVNSDSQKDLAKKQEASKKDI